MRYDVLLEPAEDQKMLRTEGFQKPDGELVCVCSFRCFCHDSGSKNLLLSALDMSVVISMSDTNFSLLERTIQPMPSQFISTRRKFMNSTWK